jgi:hypothetical protein
MSIRDAETFAARGGRARCWVVAACALGALVIPLAGIAADAPAVVNEKFSDLEPAIQMLRAEVGQNRRDVVKAAMLLTESESKTFWPMYDDYRAAMHEQGDRRVKLITDFLANRNAMSQDEAERLVKEALDIDKDKTSIKEKHFKKMSKVLSARTTARFFQIDAKLDAIEEAALAARIPLIH